MPVVTDQIGQVLVQGAAGGHRHHLHAATDAEGRQVHVQRGPHQHQLGGVPQRVGVGGRVLLGALVRRVDVAATGEHDSVERFEHVRVGIVGSDQDRAAAGGVHGLDVGSSASIPASMVVAAVLDLLGVRGQSDQRPAHLVRSSSSATLRIVRLAQRL